MVAFAEKARVVLAKVETTAGTDAAPTVGANAVRTITATPGINLEVQEIPAASGVLDDNEQAPNGGKMEPNVSVVLRGSGAAATAPDFDPLLQAAGFGVTNLASDVTGTATAGGASTISIEDADISADGQYVGMIIELTAGTGYGAGLPKQNRRLITGSVDTGAVLTVYPPWVTPPDTDTEYAIKACNLYKPISSGLKAATLKLIERESGGGSARRFTSLGSRFNMQLNLPVRSNGTLTFAGQGALQAPDDLTDPGDPTLQSSRPFSWLDAQTYLDGASICMNALTLDLGNEVITRACPNEVYGYRTGDVPRRRATGTINPDATNVATRDVFSEWAAQSSVKLWTAFGPSAGNRVSIYIPEMIYGAVQPTPIDGFMHDSINFLSGGQNQGVLLCFF